MPTQTKTRRAVTKKVTTQLRETAYDTAVINLILERNPRLEGNRAGAVRVALEYWQKADPK